MNWTESEALREVCQELDQTAKKKMKPKKPKREKKANCSLDEDEEEEEIIRKYICTISIKIY